MIDMEYVHNQANEEGLLSWYADSRAAMIGVSLRGKSHTAHDMPMQDYHCLRVLPNGWLLAVVCDGVGSEEHADIGASIAAVSFADYTVKYWGAFLDEGSILNLLKCAALYAAGKICRESGNAGNPVRQYSTTLHAAVYANGVVYYFHSGDGGIIAMHDDGTYSLLTKPQKGEDGESVVPLMAGPKAWQAGVADSGVQSILLCTDGVYDKIAGKILRKYDEGLDKAIVAFFISPWAADPSETPKESAELFRRVFRENQPNDFYPRIAKAVAQGNDDCDSMQFVADYVFQNNRPLTSLQGIQDDITIAVIQNTAQYPELQPMEYYKGPDWETINQRVYRLLYESKQAGSDKCDTQE